jgi:2-C-methyl-D-erythritol 4-phosphate cytidylyltransferase
VPDHKPHLVVALVLAGGTGSRMGRPKQFIDLLGVPALLHTLHSFEQAREVKRIYVVGDAERVERLAREAGMSKYAGCAAPGESRSISTRNGLFLLDREDPETIVLIHDGSRCLVTCDLVERVATTVRDAAADGVIPTLPVSDTIKVVADGAVLKTLDRTQLHAVQTPQAFRLGLLHRLFAGSQARLHSATDDASLVEAAGGRVLVVRGEKTNIKLTTPDDLIFAEAILKARLSSGTGA